MPPTRRWCTALAAVVFCWVTVPKDVAFGHAPIVETRAYAVKTVELYALTVQFGVAWYRGKAMGGVGASVLAHYGRELFFYRERAGLTQEELGAKVGYSNGMISQVENARKMPNLKLSQALDVVLNTGGALARLWPLVDELGSPDKAFREYAAREPFAVAVHNYEPHMLPGLLQTEAYSSAVVASARPSPTEDELTARVAMRMTRQDILSREDPPRLWTVVDEGVLYRQVGSQTIMIEQLTRLLNATRQPNVILQVYPYAAGVSPALGVPFVVAELPNGDSAIHIDGPAGIRIGPEDPETAARYRLVFDYLRASSLREDESAALVARRIKELKGQ